MILKKEMKRKYEEIDYFQMNNLNLIDTTRRIIEAIKRQTSNIKHETSHNSIDGVPYLTLISASCCKFR